MENSKLQKNIGRRSFFKASVAFCLVPSFLEMFLSACGSKSSTDTANVTTGGNCLANGTSVTIELNHGHTMVVSIADIQAGVEKSYNIQGSADHNHVVTLTAADFAKLKTNVGISETSTATSSTLYTLHSHVIDVKCA